MKPPAVLGSFDSSLRSAWRSEGRETKPKLVVNTDFPLYPMFNKAAPGYFAETVIMKLAEPVEGEQRDLADYLAEVNTLTAAWARLREEAG